MLKLIQTRAEVNQRWRQIPNPMLSAYTGADGNSWCLGVVQIAHLHVCYILENAPSMIKEPGAITFEGMLQG